MERFLKKIAHLVFLYHKFIVIVFCFLTGISLFTIFNMKIKSDILDVLPKGNKTVVHFRDFMEKYGVLDKVVIVLESGNNTIEEYVDLIENLAGKLSKSPLVEYVDYSPLAFKSDFFLKHFPLYLDERGLKQLQERLTSDGIERQIRLNRQKLISPLSSPMDSELIARDPLKLSEIIINSLKRINKDDSLDLSTGYYLTKDHSTALIFLKPTGKGKDMAFVKKLKKEMDSIILSSMKESNNPPDIKIGLTGAHILSEEARQVIRHDILSSSILSVVLIAFLIWLFYRVRVKVLISIGFTLLASLSITLSIAYLIFGSLNIVTSIVTAVLIGLYVDYSLHMVKRYGDELKENNDRRLSLEKTLTKTGSAIIISAVTTSLSFFSILITKFAGMYELGIVAGIGILLCLVSTFLIMGSLLVWISGSGVQGVLSVKVVSSGVETLINFVVRKPRRILFSGAFLIILFGFGLTKLRFNNDPEQIGVRGSQSVAALKVINQKTNKKADPLHIIIKGKDVEELNGTLTPLEKLLSGWEKNGLIERYDSINVLLPAPYIQKMKIDRQREILTENPLQLDKLEKTLACVFEKNKFVYENSYMNAYLKGIITALNRHELVGLKELEAVSNPRINYFYNKVDVSLASYIYPTDRGWDKHTLDIIKNAVNSAGSNWIVTGKSVLFDEIKTSVILGSTLATLITLLLNLIIVYWFFKKAFHVLLVMLPVVCGLLLTLGVMGYTNTPFNFVNIGTVALIFGLGVDYGIYLMQAYIEEEKRDISNALRIAGKNIMMGAATTIAGCGSLMTAKFIGIATVGIVLTLGSISCALVALFIMPALIRLKDGRL